MSLLQCNSCGATYRKTPGEVPYYHVCHDEEITAYAEHSADGKEIVTPGKRQPRAVIRDETPVLSADGKTVTIKSEGAGVTVLEA